MNKFLLPLFIITLAFSACHKDNSDPAPSVNNTGSISGIVNPANGVLFIHASTGITGSYEKNITHPDPATGQFTINNLPAGNYSLSFMAANNYYAPLPKDIIVVDRHDTDAGAFNAVKSVFSFRIGATSYTEPATLTYVNNSFNLVNTRTSIGGGFGGNSSVTTTFTINIPNFTGPGTYTCSKTTDAFISYSGFGSYNTKLDPGTASITITSIDNTARIMSGTFNATLAPSAQLSALLSANPLSITNGEFTLRY